MLQMARSRYHNCLSLNVFCMTLHPKILFPAARCVWGVSVVETLVSPMAVHHVSLAGEVDGGDGVTGGKEPGVTHRGG